MTSPAGPAPRRSVARRIGAVALGVVTIVVLSVGTDAAMRALGVFPPEDRPMPDALYILATLYRSVYAIAGSYVAARCAPDRPMAHALALGGIGLFLCVVGAVATADRGPEFGPRWYSIALIATALPCAWAGGLLHARRAAAAEQRA